MNEELNINNNNSTNKSNEKETQIDQKVTEAKITTSACRCNSMGDGTKELSFVFAIGKIRPKFPRVDVEKEYDHVLSRLDTKGKTDIEIMYSTLNQKEYRYIAREICWVFSVEGLDAYILEPRDTNTLDSFIESIRSNKITDVDVIIGIQGPIATPDMCNGLVLPVVTVDKVYTFDRESLIKSIPKKIKIDQNKFNENADLLFNRIVQIADNVGSADEHRALNYLSVRYDPIYSNTVKMSQDDYSLVDIDVIESRLSNSGRKVVDVIFTYKNRGDNPFLDKHFVRVDVTEEFPFIVTDLAPYFSR